LLRLLVPLFAVLPFVPPLLPPALDPVELLPLLAALDLADVPVLDFVEPLLLFAVLDLARLALLLVLPLLEEDVLRLRVVLGLSSPITGRSFFISPALSIAFPRTSPAVSFTVPAALLTTEPALPRASAAPPATSPSLSLAFPSTSGTPPEDFELLLVERLLDLPLLLRLLVSAIFFDLLCGRLTAASTGVDAICVPRVGIW